MPTPAPSECFRGPAACPWCATAEREGTHIMRGGVVHSPASGRSENPMQRGSHLYRLNDGRQVLAFKDRHGKIHPLKYANAAQARRAADEMSSMTGHKVGVSHKGGPVRYLIFVDDPVRDNPDLMLLGNPERQGNPVHVFLKPTDDDSPFNCPWCGGRTEWTGPDPYKVIHKCPWCHSRMRFEADSVCWDCQHGISQHGPEGCRLCPCSQPGRAENPSLMLLGNPGNMLLRKEDRKNLPALYSQENNPDPTVWVKLFTPWGGWTWYATEYDQEDTFFGLVDGHEMELGYFSLSELQGLRGPGGLRVERDIHWRPTPLSKVRGREANPGTAPSRIKASWEKFHQKPFAGKCKTLPDIPGVPEDLMELGEFVDAVGTDGSRWTGEKGARLCYEPKDKSLWIIGSSFVASYKVKGFELKTIAYRTYGKSGKDHAVYEHKFHRPFPTVEVVHARAALLQGGRYIVTDWIRK